MAVSKRVRHDVMRRDNYTCRYCRSSDNPLTIDHVTPTALGGSDAPDNLVAACKDCNAGKASVAPGAPLVAQVSDDAARWAKAMGEAWRAMQGDREAATAQLQPFYSNWNLLSQRGWSFRLPADCDEVLLKYIAGGMPLEVLVDAATVALRKSGVDDRFRYFRGVANNMLADIQATAAKMMKSEIEHSTAPHAEVDEYARGRRDMMLVPEVAFSFLQYSHLSALVDGLRYGAVQP